MAKKLVRCCRECGSPLAAPTTAGSNRPKKARDDAKFCSTPCKTGWNNRRKSRGADIYDLWMSMRYCREEAKALGVWREICRLSEVWNAEDKAAGRTSFERPGVVLARLMDSGRLPRARKMAI